MNKRYMDFVPAKGKKVGVRPVGKRVVQPRPVKKPVRTVSRPSVASGLNPRNVVPTIAKNPVAPKKPTAGNYRLGVVEDLGGGDPLGRERRIEDSKTEIRELKAKKVGMKGEKRAVPAEKMSGLRTKTEETFKTPKTRFINQDKVVKRPLSKNVYRKEVKASEEAKGPVTIIEKPEKSAKISLVVTIIITIILGAAAGTVAFLLLPK